MGMSTLQLPQSFHVGKHTFGLDDDFLWYISPHLWTLVGDGTAAAGDAAGGVITLTTGATDNNEVYLATTKEIFLIAANKPIEGECKLQYTEAVTGANNTANVFFAFSDAIAADFMVDNGAGVKTSFSGAAIFKVDGSTVWKCMVSIGTTQTILTSTLTAGGAAYQTLRIEIRPINATIAEAAFFADSGSGMVPLYDAAQTARNVPIKISFTYTNATEMMVGAGVKAGGTATTQLMLIDRLAAYQAR